MTEIVRIGNPQDLPAEGTIEGVVPLTPGEFQLQAPTQHWICKSEGKSLARCSIWVDQNLTWEGKRLGLIGHYAALVGQEAGPGLLRAACHFLVDQGCDAVVGPMDGSTWFRYRLITDWGQDPPFFLELQHPREWPDQFRSAGFNPLTHYLSSRVIDLSVKDPRMERVSQRMEQLGVKVISLADRNLEDYWVKIHQLCLQAFAQNFLYTPLDLQRFLSLYRPIVPYLEPELIQLAYDQELLVGFVFALPDLTQAQRGEKNDTLVIKTAAVLPGRRYAGLGSLLAQTCQQIGRSLGMKQAIHALMHEHNPSRNALGCRARPFRRYTLFIWEP